MVFCISGSTGRFDSIRKNSYSWLSIRQIRDIPWCCWQLCYALQCGLLLCCNLVLCCDNRKYWRRELFPFYKAGRKKTREKSDLDWHLIFDMLTKFKQELKEYFPYKVVDVEGAEADDIIGTLVPRHIMHENILIISSDGDFLQFLLFHLLHRLYIDKLLTIHPTHQTLHFQHHLIIL